MAQEMELHLKDKFLDGLDMKDKSISKIPRYNQFQEIKRLLEDMFSSSTPAIVKSPSATNFRDKLYKLNNLLTDCKMLSRKHGFNSPEELITINRIRRDLRQIKRDLQAITKDASNRDINEQRINGDSSSHDRDILRWTTRAVDATKVYGLDDEVLSMENLLLKKGSDVHQFKAIGIVGRDGIGKTTLCQLMFNKDEVKNNFNPRIWVCMARHPDDDKDEDLKVAIVKRMLRYLGVKSVCDDVKPGLEKLLCALYLQLLGKRYLIVLDDARETDSWYKELDSSLTHDKKWGDSFAFGFPKSSGGRVIVTSRNEDIANMMVGKENIHHLEPMLDTESCWAIFKDSVDKDLLPTIPSNLEELKSEVKQKCGGLPLAAKMMGRAMQEEEERTRS
ncbi:putative disease resistance protein [Rosa sericea]